MFITARKEAFSSMPTDDDLSTYKFCSASLRVENASKPIDIWTPVQRISTVIDVVEILLLINPQSLHSPRSTSMSRLISKRKEEIKHMCAKWVASTIRSFQIVTDPGLKDLVQVCLDVCNLFSTVIFGDKITY